MKKCDHRGTDIVEKIKGDLCGCEKLQFVYECNRWDKRCTVNKVHRAYLACGCCAEHTHRRW